MKKIAVTAGRAPHAGERLNLFSRAVWKNVDRLRVGP